MQISEILRQSNIDLEIINLHDFDIRKCVGCENCIKSDSCNIHDDVDKIKNKIADCDGLILASPVYLRSISGVLKIFVDRTCSWYHRPILYGKPVLSVSTTKGSGLRYTLKYLEDIGIQWGMLPSGMIGRSIINMKKPIDYKECKKFIDNLQMDKNKHRPSTKAVINFSIQKVLSNNFIDLDSKYWEKNGWKNKCYFYTCNINIYKILIATVIYKFLNSIMQKTNKH